MPYSLTVNRVMALAAFTTPVGTNTELREGSQPVTDFHDQMVVISAGCLPDLYDRLISVPAALLAQEYAAGDEALAKLEINLARREPDPTDLDVTIIQDSRARDHNPGADPDAAITDTSKNPIVGLFRTQKWDITIGELEWDVRIRPSVTACLFECAKRITKIWFTFEGVPVDPAHEPGEEDAVNFIRLTTGLAEKALVEFRTAYITAVQNATRAGRGEQKRADDRLRVSLADNTDVRFSKLVDAMNLRGMRFEEAVSANYDEDVQSGAQEVLQFITRAADGRKPDYQEIELETGRPGLAAVCSDLIPISSGGGAEKFVVAGLASSINMLTTGLPVDADWRRQLYGANVLRSISAARPLSARLAGTKARDIDRRLHAGQRPALG